MTTRARVRSIACMAPEVHHQGGALGESFLAVGALVGPFARVRAPVHAQIILRDKSFAAEIANVRFLTCMLS